ncbi:MAG TPA: hypothetical protein VKA84_24730, partial [Gemmatimonadaceae bacterium]|nr:hypothetical protein [Gemmatimonadaceae bacterium]
MLLIALLGCAARGARTLAPVTSGGPSRGTLILTGGEMLPGVRARFAELAGGADAEIVYVPTAASSIRLENGYVYDPPNSGANPKTVEFEAELARLFGVRRVTVLHTRDRATAERDAFVEPLRRVRGVWLSSGNAGRL